MTAFCVARLTPPAELLAVDGVLRGSDLGLTTDAQALAARIVAQAQAERASLLAAAEEQARLSSVAAQASALAESAAMIEGLRQLADGLGERAEGIVIDLAVQLFNRLMLDTTPERRAAASYRRLLLEAPPRLVNAVLRMHPDDIALATGWEWPVKADAALAPGVCRLEADSGHWRADFHAAAEALVRALTEPKPAVRHS